MHWYSGKVFFIIPERQAGQFSIAVAFKDLVAFLVSLRFKDLWLKHCCAYSCTSCLWTM